MSISRRFLLLFAVLLTLLCGAVDVQAIEAGFPGKMGPGGGGRRGELNFLGGSLPRQIGFTRASSRTCFNSMGAMVVLASDVPCFDYNPVTLQPRGIAIEGQRTNLVRNGSASGGSVSSPPTNWSVAGGTGGVSWSLIGPSSLKGIPGYTYRVSGTANLNTGFALVQETASGIASSISQTYAVSYYLAVTRGSPTNLQSFRVRLEGTNGSTRTETPAASNNIKDVLSAEPLRYDYISSLTNVATTNSRPFLDVAFSSGSAIDFDIFIGAVQQELAPFASSYIPTSGVSAVRASDVASITNLSGIGFNATEGTFFVVGSYLTEVSTQYSLSLYKTGDGVNNRIGLRRGGGTPSVLVYESYVSGSADVGVSTASLPAPYNFRAAFAYALNNYAISLNGAAVSTDGTAGVPALDALVVGNDSGLSNPMFGWVERISYTPAKLPNSQLQQMAQ